MSGLVDYLYLTVTALLIDGLLLVIMGHRLRRGHWLASIAITIAVLAGAALILQQGFGLQVGERSLWAAFLCTLLIIALSEHWNALGQLTLSLVIQTSGAYIIYLGWLTASSGLGPWSLFFSITLIILISAALILTVVHTFEVMDVLCRIKWRRVATAAENRDYFPKVSLHVPAYNEPSDMVIQTLDALAKLDYPNYEVLMVDNNTTDEALWRPLEAHCRKLGFKFIHLENWPGFKSGALNYALTQVDPETEIVGIIDADYVVEPDYLKDLIGHFKNPKLAFLQSPQDYRDFSGTDKFALACYQAYKYFFKLSMTSRNERNAIIFTGTMGLIRRDVLEQVGGWDEWCITEDAEISLKILNMGYESLYIDRTYGRGLMPLNFEGLKKQRFRWAFGGMQVLRMHWRKLLPFSGLVNPENRMTFKQKFDYWSGGLQWLGDPLTFAFTVLLIIGAASYTLTQSVYLQTMAGATLFLPFVFIVFGLLKILWALRIRLQCNLAQAIRAFLSLLSLTWVVTLACVLGLTRREGVFLRTPKQKDNSTWKRALRIVSRETFISALCIATIAWLLNQRGMDVTTATLCVLLGWQAIIYASALLMTRWSLHSEAMADPQRPLSSRTTGKRFHAMVTDRRAVAMVTALVFVIGGLYYVSIEQAPEKEIALRGHPASAALVPHRLIPSTAETRARGLIFVEERASRREDLVKILSLWLPDGHIRDANYTPDDPSDDRSWRGLAQIRQRYRQEFTDRTYISLRHLNLDARIDDKRAVIVNDLDAVIRTNGKRQQVHLPGSDRWELEFTDDQWRIRSLVVNNTSRP